MLEILLIVPREMLFGCGDLIFSSHMIFSLVFVRTYHKYGTQRFLKQCAWLTVVIQSLLIIASRKHYTVDVVVAWYTVNLVVFLIDKKLSELPDRSGSTPLLLPLSKDSKTKEEINHKLLNGNSGDSAADWVKKSPALCGWLFVDRHCDTQTYHLFTSLSQVLADDGKFLLAPRKSRRNYLQG